MDITEVNDTNILKQNLLYVAIQWGFHAKVFNKKAKGKKFPEESKRKKVATRKRTDYQSWYECFIVTVPGK